MTFEEAFPSLKNKASRANEGEWAIGDWVHTSDVQEACIDKQRVRNALALLEVDLQFNDTSIIESDIAWIKKELGL